MACVFNSPWMTRRPSQWQDLASVCTGPASSPSRCWPCRGDLGVDGAAQGRALPRAGLDAAAGAGPALEHGPMAMRGVTVQLAPEPGSHRLRSVSGRVAKALDGGRDLDTGAAI